MRDYDFVARLIGWLDMPGEGEPYPHDADPYPADPRDASFDCLCTLYLEADEAKRAQIAAHFARDAHAEHASPLPHRLLGSGSCAPARQRRPLQPDPLHAPPVLVDGLGQRCHLAPAAGALAAAAILHEREDYRDIMVSLAFLHHAARRAGIDPDPHFREVGGLARPETEEFMRGFLERDEAEIEEMVEAFS